MKKIITIAMVLMATSVTAQWWKPTKSEWIGYGAIAVSGASYGVNQAIYHHRFGQGQQYWDIKTSWKNKYQDWDGGNKGPAYLGSKTWLVWTTDGAHLTNTIDKTFLITGVAFLSVNAKSEFQSYPKNKRVLAFIVKKLLIPSIIKGATFEIVFKNL